MLYIEKKLEIPGGHTKIRLFIEIEALEFKSPAAILKVSYLYRSKK